MRDGAPDAAAPVFPGPRRALGMSNMTMLMLLRRMKRDDLTVHGFRSTFSDWAAERTAYPREVVEMALAHTIENKVEAAYRRGDLFEKRRKLMEAWAQFCGSAHRHRRRDADPDRALSGPYWRGGPLATRRNSVSACCTASPCGLTAGSIRGMVSQIFAVVNMLPL
jgi:hypothetical protein